MREWPQNVLDAADTHARKNPPGRIKPTLRRYSWSRLHPEVITGDVWGLVADMAGVGRDRVEAFVARLEVYASTNTPRGSVEGFSIRALAVTWRCEADELARIYAALEEPEIGWLDQDHVVSFWDRNPDEEDPTAAERSKRYRARKKNAQIQSLRRAEKDAGKAGYPQVGSVTRDDRDVTARSDQTNRKVSAGENSPPALAEAPQAIQRNSGESGDGLTPTEQAELYLATDGLRLVVERCECLVDVARLKMRRWRAALGDDPAALTELLRNLGETGMRGDRFQGLIDDELSRRRMLAHGPPLPLMPPRPQRRVSDG